MEMLAEAPREHTTLYHQLQLISVPASPLSKVEVTPDIKGKHVLGPMRDAEKHAQTLGPMQIANEHASNLHYSSTVSSISQSNDLLSSPPTTASASTKNSSVQDVEQICKPFAELVDKHEPDQKSPLDVTSAPDLTQTSPLPDAGILSVTNVAPIVDSSPVLKSSTAIQQQTLSDIDALPAEVPIRLARIDDLIVSMQSEPTRAMNVHHFMTAVTLSPEARLRLSWIQAWPKARVPVAGTVYGYVGKYYHPSLLWKAHYASLASACGKRLAYQCKSHWLGMNDNIIFELGLAGQSQTSTPEPVMVIHCATSILKQVQGILSTAEIRHVQTSLPLAIVYISLPGSSTTRPSALSTGALVGTVLSTVLGIPALIFVLKLIVDFLFFEYPTPFRARSRQAETIYEKRTSPQAVPSDRFHELSNARSELPAHPLNTQCGREVRSFGKSASLSLLLEIRGAGLVEYFALTVDHVFHAYNPEWTEDTNRIAPGSSISAYANNLETFPRQAAASPNSPAFASLDNQFLFSRQGGQPMPRLTGSDCDPYLDWALVDISDLERPSPMVNLVYYPTKKATDCHILRTMAAEELQHATRVLVISGVRGTLEGTLHPSLVASLGWRRTEEQCPLWVVELDDERTLLPGECGSLVVTRTEFDVVGHVVSSNALGDVYVVPLFMTMKQIEHKYAHWDLKVTLPAYDDLREHREPEIDQSRSSFPARSSNRSRTSIELRIASAGSPDDPARGVADIVAFPERIDLEAGVSGSDPRLASELHTGKHRWWRQGAKRMEQVSPPIKEVPVPWSNPDYSAIEPQPTTTTSDLTEYSVRGAALFQPLTFLNTRGQPIDELGGASASLTGTVANDELEDKWWEKKGTSGAERSGP